MSEAMRAFFEGRGWPAANVGEPSPELIAAVEAEARRAPPLRAADPRGGYAYIASPYSHADPAVEDARYSAAVDFAAWCCFQGYVVYSPIIAWHVVARRFGMPSDAASWARSNEAMLAHAAAMFVLQLDGWLLSAGVKAEVDAAIDAGLPIYQFEPIHDARRYRVTRLGDVCVPEEGR